MTQNRGSQKRVEKPSRSSDRKKDSKHRHHKDKKHAMSSNGSSGSRNDVYTEPGPHGSISVKAIRGSSFLYARNGSYAILEGAYMKEVYDVSGAQTVVMNCKMSHGTLIHSNIRQAKFEYPDGTFQHCVPICDVKVLSMQRVYDIGRGREYIHSSGEVYGRDSVLLQMRTGIVDKLKRQAYKVYSKQYAKDHIVALGKPDEENPNVTLITCAVKRHAKLVANVNGQSKEKRIDGVVGEENKDIDGDVLVALKYVRNVEKRTAELIFELQDVMVRRSAERLFGSSSSGAH